MLRCLSRHSFSAAETPPWSVEAAAGSGPVLIIHPDPGMAADMARALTVAGLLIATSGAVDAAGQGHPAVLIFDATGQCAGAAERIARTRTSAPGVRVLFLTTP